MIPKFNHRKTHDRSAYKDVAFRGNRHARNLWAELLPSARKRLVDQGLFTAEGEITAEGLEFLAKGSSQ
jgi:hypothetical protein